MNKIAKAILCLSLCIGISGCLETAVTNPNKTGETPIGTIRELTLEKNSVDVEKGTTVSVKVTDGNGGYTAVVTAGGDFATVSILGNVIGITGVAEGEATVTVGDNEEESQQIKVTVTPAQVVVEPDDNLFVQNMKRAMEIVDIATEKHRALAEMKRWYNPVRESVQGSETASIWMYTGVIEAVNAILHGLEEYKEVDPEFYNAHYTKYLKMLGQLYDNITYYRGKFTLVSFTQTKEWQVYAVNRAMAKDAANPGGGGHRENVYDDQEWLIREMLESYKLTGEEKYLQEAEYLTEYVLDGWDTTLDANGNEHGGIPWGPGYCSIHACSNGPLISPLVWLHEIYKGKADDIEYRYIGGEDKQTRLTRTMSKEEYYLMYAKKVYDYQKSKLLISEGVYNDMIGAKVDFPETEEIDGVTYRKYAERNNSSSPSPHSYNSGTMLSGAADLFRATGDEQYLNDAKTLTSKTFDYFAKSYPDRKGCYTYKWTSDFVRWFDNVLMRGYVDLYPYYPNTRVCIASFQNNLDWAYENSNKNGFLPSDLMGEWNTATPGSNDNRIEALTTFAYATEYAALARYELQREN